MMRTNDYRCLRRPLQSVVIAAGVLALLGGCTASRVKFDKAGMREVKKIAVVEYTVPKNVVFRDNPRDAKSVPTLAKVVYAAMGPNGVEAATFAHEGFADGLNKAGLSFKVMSRSEMMANAQFQAVAAKYVKAEAAQGPAKKEEGMASKALGFASAYLTADDVSSPAAAKGLPEFGLAQTWSSEPSALRNTADEKQFVKDAVAALGVDAVMVINDPGMSYSCRVCVGGSGATTTGSAFLVTLVDSTGQVVLEMRQWFNFGDGTAAMTGWIVNPLQAESLYRGHGDKMARVFTDYFKEEGGK